jgi:DNA-binding XRE family transcriptional regulator
MTKPMRAEATSKAKVSAKLKGKAKAKPQQVDLDPAAELREVFSYNLRMARLSVRMTQRDLADASGISQKHISEIEREGSNLGLDLIALLARGIGVTPAELLTPKPPRRTT